MAVALSRKSLHVSSLMVREFDLLTQFRDFSLVCEVTPSSIRLGSIRVTSSLLDDIRLGQRSNPFLKAQI